MTVCIKNVGNVLLRVENMKVKVSAVNPPGPVDVLVRQTGDLLDPGRAPTVWKAPWQVLHERVAPFDHDFEIEPNDTDDIAFDFPIACEVSAVSVDVHIRNSSKKRDGRSLGWERNALFDLTGQPSSLRFEAGVLRYARKHLRADFVSVVECPDVVGPSRTREDEVGAARSTLLDPRDSQEGTRRRDEPGHSAMRSCRREEDALEWTGFTVFKPISQHPQCQRLRLGLRLLLAVAVDVHTG